MPPLFMSVYILTFCAVDGSFGFGNNARMVFSNFNFYSSLFLGKIISNKKENEKKKKKALVSFLNFHIIVPYCEIFVCMLYIFMQVLYHLIKASYIELTTLIWTVSALVTASYLLVWKRMAKTKWWRISAKDWNAVSLEES